jgi:hypothetical protein
MFKYFLILLLSFLIANTAYCGKKDTVILYYNYHGQLITGVSSLAEADYFRVILPPDSGDTRRNVKEFYKNGKIKMITKLASGYNLSKIESSPMIFDGDFVSFYPNGRKFSVAHYVNGQVDGLEYFFYQNGRVHCTLKHQEFPNNDVLYWECYDTLGNQICKKGIGRFVSYTGGNGYPAIMAEGQVTNGYFDGEWKGHTMAPFDIRFITKYKKGRLISSVGYDRHDNSYPFKDEIEDAVYKNGLVDFVETLHEHIKLPKDTSGKRMSIDTLYLKFVVEPDGHIAHPTVQEPVDIALQNAIFGGLKKCGNWKPARMLGVPVRTEFTIPLFINEHFELKRGGSLAAVYYMHRVVTDNEISDNK